MNDPKPHWVGRLVQHKATGERGVLIHVDGVMAYLSVGLDESEIEISIEAIEPAVDYVQSANYPTVRSIDELKSRAVYWVLYPELNRWFLSETFFINPTMIEEGNVRGPVPRPAQ